MGERTEGHDSQAARVWREWNALGEDEPAPVKTIAQKLGMPTGEVARIVYPPATFDEWDDSQEPPPEGR